MSDLHLAGVCCAALSCGLLVSVSRADTASGTNVLTATFSHKPGSPQTLLISPKPGDSLKVTVTDTCSNYFELAVENLLTQPPAGTRDLVPPCPGTDQLTLTIPLDSRYGAYIVSVRAKSGMQMPVHADTKVDLNPTDFVIYVDTSSPWTTDFSGGFTFSKLTNPKYSLQPGTGSSSGTYTVVEDNHSEDSATLGFAGFVTVSRKNWTLPAWLASPTVGITFGLGVSTGSKIEFFPGLSLKFGDLILTGGVNVGSIDTLPSGLKVGGTTTNANALNSLPSRISSGLFLALSYKFLGSSVQQTLQGRISSPSPPPSNSPPPSK